MNDQRVNLISGRVVLCLSLFVLSLVAGATFLTTLDRFNPAPDGDEGTAAHLFQLAIVLLLPAGLVFLATAEWRRPWNVARRPALPTAALVVAFATLYYMEHMVP